MALNINHDTNDISASGSGTVTIDGAAVGGGVPKYADATLTQLGSTISLSSVSSYTYNNFASSNSLSDSSSYDFLLFQADHRSFFTSENGACYLMPDYENATWSQALWTASAYSFSFANNADITTTWVVYKENALSNTSLDATRVADNPWKYHTHSIATGRTFVTNSTSQQTSAKQFTNPWPLSFKVSNPYSNNWSTSSQLRIYGGVL